MTRGSAADALVRDGHALTPMHAANALLRNVHYVTADNITTFDDKLIGRRRQSERTAALSHDPNRSLADHIERVTDAERRGLIKRHEAVQFLINIARFAPSTAPQPRTSSGDTAPTVTKSTIDEITR